jgi:hypothetical protein
VLLWYPQTFAPLFSSASCLCSLNDRAPSEATDGANPSEHQSVFDGVLKSLVSNGWGRLDVGDAQSAARKPPAKPEAQWNNSELVSIKWILSGFV